MYNGRNGGKSDDRETVCGVCDDVDVKKSVKINVRAKKVVRRFE